MYQEVDKLNFFMDSIEIRFLHLRQNQYLLDFQYLPIRDLFMKHTKVFVCFSLDSLTAEWIWVKFIMKVGHRATFFLEILVPRDSGEPWDAASSK